VFIADNAIKRELRDMALAGYRALGGEWPLVEAGE
jgi:hypothetical protein